MSRTPLEGASSRELGRLAEGLAADFLRRRGATVLGRNLRVAVGEIDLLVEISGEPTVVEVRSRFGHDPLVNFDDEKHRQVWRCARSLDPPCHRVDLIAVRFDRDGVALRWLPQVV